MGDIAFRAHMERLLADRDRRELGFYAPMHARWLAGVIAAGVLAGAAVALVVCLMRGLLG